MPAFLVSPTGNERLDALWSEIQRCDRGDFLDRRNLPIKHLQSLTESSFDPKTVQALTYLHRFSLFRHPNDIYDSALILSRSIAIQDHPEYGFFFHLGASFCMEIFETNGDLAYLDRAIDLLDPFVNAEDLDPTTKMMAFCEYSVICLQYALAAEEPQALQSALEYLGDGRNQPVAEQWTSSFGYVRSFIFISHVVSRLYNASYSSEVISKSILSIKTILNDLPQPSDDQYTLLQILVLTLILVLSEVDNGDNWLASLDILHQTLSQADTSLNDLTSVLHVIDQCHLQTSRRTICLLYMADTVKEALEKSQHEVPESARKDHMQSLWLEQWEECRSYLQHRIQHQASREGGATWRKFKISATVAPRLSSFGSVIRFRAADPIGTHSCIFESAVTAVEDEEFPVINTDPGHESPHHEFVTDLQSVIQRLSMDDIEYVISHPKEITSRFEKYPNILIWDDVPISWRKSPSIIAYLVWQRPRKGLRDFKLAGRHMLEVNLDKEPAFLSLLYEIMSNLKLYEADLEAVGTASRLMKEFLRCQVRGSPRHLLGVIELGSSYVVEYFNHSSQPTLFALAMELFREALSLIESQNWLLEFRKLIVLGRILHYRFMMYSESDASLTVTIQLITDLLDLLPPGGPFRASVLETFVVSALIFLSKCLPTKRWHESLKIFSCALEFRLLGSPDSSPPENKNPQLACQDVLEGGLNNCSHSLASEAICLFHISDIARSAALDCIKHPGFMPLSLDMYNHSLKSPSHHCTALHTEETGALMDAWALERNIVQEAINLATRYVTEPVVPSVEQPPITIFRYRAAIHSAAYKAHSYSHACVLHFYTTKISKIEAESESSDSASVGPEVTEPIDTHHVPAWPDNLITFVDTTSDVLSGKDFRLPSTIIPGIEKVIHNEDHELFLMPLEQRTIRAFIRHLDSDLRELESKATLLTTEIIRSNAKVIYWDPRDVQLSRRMDKLKSGTAYLARMGPLQALISHGPERCLELVETARSQFWSRLLRLRISFDGLPNGLAEELGEVAQALDQCKSQTMTSVTKEEMQKQFDLEGRFNHLVATARSIPGFENLLKPKSHDMLLAAASEGPVVVLIGNDSTYAALILQKSGLGSVFLPDLIESELDKMITGLNRVTTAARGAMSKGSDSDGQEGQEDDEMDRAIKRKVAARPETYQEFLEQMWKFIVKPIFDHLGFLSDYSSEYVRPRLWWCPTGKLAFLPIHAAGTRFGQSNMDSTSKYVISSYTPTISALIDARSSYRLSPQAPSTLRTLVLAQPTTKDHSALPMTLKELELLETIIPQQSLIRIGKDDTLAKTNTNRTVEEALQHLTETSILHLACHGHQDRDDPLSSGFQLEDGRLSVAHLISCHTPNALLAFLSACESASNDFDVPDESLNLAAAILYSGFRSVIGTMWSMNDNDGPQVARAIYQELFKTKGGGMPFDSSVIPRALDSAVRMLQDSGVHPARWATYIHVGL